MTITTLIIINIAFILGISLAFILGRKTGQSGKSVMKKSKKLKKKAKHRRNGAKKIKAKVTDGKAKKRAKTGSKTQKKQIIDLDPNNYIQNLAKEALETSKDIAEMTDKN